MRILPAVAATSLTLLASGLAHGVGLGNIVRQSAIGEPLRIEVALIGSGEADVSCLRLAPGAASDLPWIRQARVSLGGSGAGRRVIITANQPVYDPIVMLGLELSCEGTLRREYPLLLPSSVAVASTPLAEPASPDASAAAPVRRPTQQSSEAAGQSLGELAASIYPDSRSLRRRFIAATRRAHPDQFPSRGAVDRPIPDAAALDIAALRRQAENPPRPARPAPAASAPEPSRAEKPAPAAAPRAAAEPRPEPRPALAPAAAETSAAQGDRLTVLGDAPPPELKLSFSLSDPGRIGRTSEDERERMRQEQRLLIALDDKIIAQLEIANKIRELEQYQRQLTGDAGKLGVAAGQPDAAQSQAAITAEARAETSPPPAVRPETEEADSGSWWQYVAGSAGFALLAGLLALYLQRRRLEREREEAEFFGLGEVDKQSEAAPAGGAAPQEAERGLLAPAPAMGEPAPFGTHEALAEPATAMDFAPLDWEPPGSLMPGDTIAPLPMGEDDQAGEHDSAVELAEIMMSFGRVQGAAQTLADFIRGNPKQAVVPWLKLLEVYKTADMRSEFEGLAQQLNHTFNVKAVSWDDFDIEKASQETIERMPHIIAELVRLWGTVECQAYLHKLLRDNRDGTRQGFPLAVIDDILCLLGVLNQHLGPYYAEVPGQTTSTAH